MPMNNMMQLLREIQNYMQNPAQMLAQRGINIPQQMANDPDAIIRHLMNTRQMNQAQYNEGQQMAKQFCGMFGR